ncbi:esterase [Erwinia sp. P6884]|uniref:esterase n=1 Tax=Erwinia sp. P6884 TaxID=3141450 RepID=UPI00319B2170
MIEIDTESFAGIDCLHAAPAGKRHQPLPTVIFYHGFASSKEVYAYFGVALAQTGFRVILPDADQHGARYEGDAGFRLSHFWEILKSSIDGLPALEAALREKKLVEAERFAVAGASMGGMTALGALARYSHLSCAACLMGSGYYMSLSQRLYPPLVAETAAQQEQFARRMAPLAAYDISHQLGSIASRPLLVWHGEADEVVPADESARLVKSLREAKLDGNLTYLTEPGVGHRITPTALAAVTTFFGRHL